MPVVNPMVVETGFVHVLAPNVEEGLKRRFNSGLLEFNVNFTRCVVRVQRAHGASGVV